jgi:4-methylaminobutanoate oxidase (formaldehyde-forming)
LTRIVVIGGGITGCSIAYHLARRGETDVVLLDKGPLTSGSTWHAAGLLTHFHTSPALMRMRKHSITLYRRLQAEAGRHIGWNEVGSLRVASSPDQLKFLQRQVGMAKAIGLEVEIISPAEALSIMPVMSSESLYGAIYLPGDGHVDPNGVTMEIARLARGMGVTVLTGTRVTGIERGPRGQVVAVTTEGDRIETEIVVNAAGMWGRRVGEMVGADLPMTPLMHQHLTTRPIPGHELAPDTPCLRDPENLVYMREEQGGFLIGGFERDPVPWSVEGVPWDFTARLLPSDWELFRPILDGAVRRVPLLAGAELTHLVNGPEAITPDSRPLLGPVPGVGGFWAACGLSHTGFGAGAAIGEVIASWIIDGEPPYDVTEMNVRRFGPIYRDTAFSAARACESYRYYYVLRYPHDEWETARPRRMSPLDPQLLALGAVFGEKNGWERVNYFDPPGRRAGAEQGRWGWGKPPFFDQVEAEHRAAREGVAIWDMTSFGKIEVAGPGALGLLQRLSDNDLDQPVGRVVYTQLLNPMGGIEADVTIARIDRDRFRVVTGANFVASDLAWINAHAGLATAAVEVREVTEELATIGLWGPRSREVLQAVTPDDLSNAAFPYMTGRTISVGEVEVWAQRVTYVGELGWEIYCRSPDAVSVWNRLMEAGSARAIRPAGYKALDSLRLEKGYRYWSADITPEESPYEAGLGFCVKPNKGEFIGREALLERRELQQRLCTLKVDLSPSNGVLYGGEPVLADGATAGRLRSAGYGYTVGHAIGLVYLPLAMAVTGTPLLVESFGERFPAVVAADVLYDPGGERIRA